MAFHCNKQMNGCEWLQSLVMAWPYHDQISSSQAKSSQARLFLNGTQHSQVAQCCLLPVIHHSWCRACRCCLLSWLALHIEGLLTPITPGLAFVACLYKSNLWPKLASNLLDCSVSQEHPVMHLLLGFLATYTPQISTDVEKTDRHNGVRLMSG